MIKENIKKGERISRYTIEAKVNGKWLVVSEGKSVGHKRIEKIKSISASAFRLTINQSSSIPDIVNFSVFNVE